LQGLWAGYMHGRSSWMRACPGYAVAIADAFTITTSLSRPTTVFRGLTEGAVLSIGTRRTRLPDVRVGPVPRVQGSVLRCAGSECDRESDRREKLLLRLDELMRDARAGYQGSEAKGKLLRIRSFPNRSRCFSASGWNSIARCVRVRVRRGERPCSRWTRRRGGCVQRGRGGQRFCTCRNFRHWRGLKRMRNILRQAEEKGSPGGQIRIPAGFRP